MGALLDQLARRRDTLTLLRGQAADRVAALDLQLAQLDQAATVLAKTNIEAIAEKIGLTLAFAEPLS